MSAAAREAATGALAGAASLAATYPLYTLVVRLQVKRGAKGGGAARDAREGHSPEVLPLAPSKFPRFTAIAMVRDLLRDQGWRGFYRGFQAALVAVFMQSGVYYWFYEVFRALHAVAAEPLWHVVVGFEAGVATTLLTNPLWVVNSRQMTEGNRLRTESSPAEALRELVQEEGLGGLFSGVVPALVLCSNPAIQFGSAQVVARRLEVSPMLRERPVARAFLVGGISKTVSTVATYPLQTVKLCLQKSGQGAAGGEVLFRSPAHVVTHILRTEGAFGFFRGLGTKLVQSVVTAAFLFSFRNQLSNAVSILMVKRLLHRVRAVLPKLKASQLLTVPTPRPLRNW